MRYTALKSVIGVAGILAALAAWPGTSQAQLGLPPVPNIIPPLPVPTPTPSASAPSGQASAVTAVVLGTVNSLAATGTLVDASDPLGTGLPVGSIPGLLSAEALHAATMGWSDQVVSEASLASLAMTVAGTGVSADTIVSRAIAVSGGAPAGASSIEGLTIGGVPIFSSGAPNQQISLGVLSVVLNEQIQTANGIIVNAVRVRTLDGLTDVVIGSSRAGI
jgi:hypothetical protein